MTHVKQQTVARAVNLLMKGYEEEMNLYAVVHELTVRQKQMLLARAGFLPVVQLHARKEEVLDVIGRLEREMEDAKHVVMAQRPKDCPHRLRLAALLDSVRGMIEDIRDVEQDNARMLATAV